MTSDAPRAGARSAPRTIALLGSTGSIGTQTIDVVRRLGPERARIVALAARKNAALLSEQVSAAGATHAALTDTSSADELRNSLSGTKVKAYAGLEAMTELASLPEVDTVVVAVAGAAGLAATLAACRTGKRVCIATKEVLVAAGELVTRTARENGAELLPIDSEHSAIFQCVQGYTPSDIERLHITASGGPFRTWTAAQIARARPEDALKHPTWRMGGKITIDSATLMNKGLEVIEAHWLFGIPLEDVSVVVHPQSVIHSFAEMRDGALLAQLGLPDMRLPIQIALIHPDKVDTGMPRLRPAEISALTFEEPDHQRFPAIQLARAAAARGGTAPAVLNAANEAAVQAFLEERIGFTDICRFVERLLNEHNPEPAGEISAVLEADLWARRRIGELLAA